MTNFKKRAEILLRELASSNILKSIDKMLILPDDLKMTSYCIELNDSKSFSDGHSFFGSASGFSYLSSKNDFALFKALIEAIERFSCGCYREKDVIYGKFNELTVKAIDPSLYTHEESVKDKKLGWVKGINLLTKKTCFIPAQAVYLTYKGRLHEPFLAPSITTGCAGGIDHESTLLRGIYEVVERDAFMTVYLLKIAAKRINPLSINNKKMKLIISDLNRYNLELYLFDITNDLEIPSFLSLIIDLTGLGPSVCAGSKSNLDAKTAIFGSIEEALNIRPWQRQKIIGLNNNNFKPKKIDSFEKRGKLWLSTKMIKHLDFLISQEPRKIKITSFNKTPQNELKDVLNIFRKTNINIYYTDISYPKFKKLGYLVYKAIIPQLQELYADETKKNINMERLKRVAKHFGKEDIVINSVPHLFL